MSIISSFQYSPFLLVCLGKKELFSELLCTWMNWNFRIQRLLFYLSSELFSTGIYSFPLFYTSEWESTALEHCCWCEEGYKRKTTQSDYTLMRQFMFSWTDSSLGSTDLWTALIVWGARSAWKCQITRSAFLMVCWCPLVLYYGLLNFFECGKHLFREQITCRALLQLAWVQWTDNWNCWATAAAGKKPLRQQRAFRISKQLIEKVTVVLTF